MNPLTREAMRSRAEGCRNAAASYRLTRTDCRELTRTANSDEEKKVGRAWAGIIDRTIAMQEEIAKLYDRAARGEEIT